MYRIRTITLAVAVALITCALVPTVATAVSRDAVIARGKVWLKAVRVDPKTGKKTVGVPYSQGAYAMEDGSPVPTSTPGAGYRTDCSGFVSMCWNLRTAAGKPYSTDTYSMGQNQSSLFRLTGVKQAELMPGDIILKSKVWYPSGTGHVIIFAGWSKSDMSEYWALEQTGPTTKYSKRPYPQTGYRPFRSSVVDGFDRARVTYGGTFTVSGVAVKASNATTGPVSVVATDGVVGLALFGADGRLNALPANVPVDPTGRFALTYAPVRSGKFAVRYRQNTSASPEAVLVAGNVTVAPYVSGVSVKSAKLVRKKVYTFAGYVNPRVASQLRVYRYNTRAHKYYAYKNVNVAVSRSKTASGFKFTARWKPTVAGKYRVYWRTAAPSGMTYETSASRYVTVK